MLEDLGTSRSESVHFLVLTSLQLVASATMAQLNLLTRRGVEASHAHGRDPMATTSNLQVKPYAVVKRGWRQIEKELSHTRPIDDFR